MSPLRKAYYILRYLGPRVVWLRAGIYLNRFRKTHQRVFGPRPWDEIHLDEITKPGTPTATAAYAAYKRNTPRPFFFPLGQPPEIPAPIRSAHGEREPALAERLRLLADDRCVWFFRTPSPEPIDWYANPLLGKRARPADIWCEIPDFAPDQGDARALWEPARAAWALDLARAQARGEKIDAAALYWRWLDSWMTACPPWSGFQWKCGQESSVRFFALAVGFWTFAADSAASPERWEQFARLAWATGYRVAHHIRYAISQKNNHAISEACGLLLVSHLFPEFREAERWAAVGRDVLIRELRRQVYADGSYVQQSMNYHRVMLHGALIGMRLAELVERPFPRDVYDLVGRAGEFLFQMSEPETGRIPLYGSNDGANVLPLSECDFTDFRPTIQAVHLLTQRRRLLPPGPWDELSVWLFGADAVQRAEQTPRAPVASAFERGGYYTLRQKESWGMVRCHTYVDRPAHMDMLHFDLWWRGLNVFCDCGSYLYYCPERPDVEHHFKSIAAHNTVELDGKDPLELVSRFLWLPWPKARVLRHEIGGAGRQVFEGAHYGYRRAPWNAIHRRLIVAPADDVWIVVDDVLGAGEHEVALRWHMIDVPSELDAEAGTFRLNTERGTLGVSLASSAQTATTAVVRGRDDVGRVQGFESPYYAERLPIPTLESIVRGGLPVRWVTVVAPNAAPVVRRLGIESDVERWRIGVADAAFVLALAPLEACAADSFISCKSE